MSTEPRFATQLNEFKQPEKVDVSQYCFKIICKEPGCFQIRYVRSQDRAQTHHCKSCTRILRLRVRATRARNTRARKNKEKVLSVKTLPTDSTKL